MARSNFLPLIGITMGDPAGIGPEIIVKALSKKALFKACRPVVFGDPSILTQAIEKLGARAIVQRIKEVPDEDYSPGRIFLLPLSQSEVGCHGFGRPDRISGQASVKYIEEAVRWARDGKVDAITTCPIRKEAIRDAGYSFSGHTELLAHLAKVPRVAMMFVGSRWRVVVVTTHLPLREVPQWTTKERVFSTLKLTQEGLQGYFGIQCPRIAVLGPNPHAGEDGLLGDEERKEIIPAIEKARSEGIDAHGPYPADAFFHSHGPSGFDAVVAMYHDQGLIPIKAIDFRKAVNLSLGLPFIRTSVAHGTAYDIAGRGLADPENLVAAILLASNLSKFKRKY